MRSGSRCAARQRCVPAPLAAVRADGERASGISVQLAAAAASAAVLLSSFRASAVSGGGGLGNDFDFQGGRRCSVQCGLA